MTAKTIQCAYCGGYAPYPGGFPNRHYAKCEACTEEHLRELGRTTRHPLRAALVVLVTGLVVALSIAAGFVLAWLKT